MPNSIAIRLATDGSAQVKADFSAIADSGDVSAKRIVSAYDRASDQVQAAIDKQAKAAQNVAGIMPSNVQATVNRSVGTGFDGSQNANAAQFAALLAQQEQQAERVRAAIDPLYTAQKRYDQEIGVAGNLLKQGVISEAEHAAAVAASGKVLQDARNALDGHSSALGLNRQQTIIAQSAVLRFTDAIIAGRNPLTAFALEAHKGVEVLSTDDEGMAGGLAKVAGLVNPVTIGIAAITAVIAVGTAAWVGYTDALAKLEALAGGAGAVIGVTGQALEQNAEAAASAGVLTVGAARKIETGFVEMGGIGSDVLTGLTKLTADFAASTGQSTEQAEQALGKIFQDPIKGAEELASRYGTLSQAQVEQIRQIEDENGVYAAQAKLLDDLGPAFDGAAKHAEGLKAAFDDIKSSISEAWSKLGGFLTGVTDATPAAQRLQQLLAERAKLGDSFAPGLRSQLDQGISDAQAQIARARANADAQSNKFGQDALKAGTGYTGYDQRRQLEEQRNALARALNDPKTVADYQKTGQLGEQREALEAYTRAINTFLGPAEKKRLIDQDEARLAQSRRQGPQAVAAAGRQLSIDQARGVVETDADAQADAAAKGEQSRARLDNAAAKHAATLGREADSMRANAAAALAAASAYLQSAAAGEDAEARQKAATDAVKSGISVDDQYSRQQALNVANAIKDGDKQTAQLRDEATARQHILGLVASGTLSAGQMNDALADETKLRPLLIAQAQAQGDAITAATTAVKAHTQALKDDRATQEAVAAVQAKFANDNTAAGARDEAEFAGDQTGKGRIEIARRAAEREAAQRFGALSPDDPARNGFVDSSANAASAGLAATRAKMLADIANGQRDQTEQLQAQIGLVGQSAAAQDQVLDRLRLEQVLRTGGVALTDEQAQKVLANSAAEDQLKAHLQSVNASWQELNQFGDNFVDTVLNPSNWSNFGDMGKKVLADLEQELIKLAAINPLKNALFGENNPTLGSIGGLLGGKSGGGLGGIGGLLGKVFGHGFNLSALGSPGLNIGGGVPSSMAVSQIDLTSFLPHFAAGTEYAPGGPAWINENGQELVDLPRGAKVTNAADTRRMLSTAAPARGGDVHIYANDAVLTDTVRGWVRDGMRQAAAQGAAGGAQQATRAAAVQKRRSFNQG